MERDQQEFFVILDRFLPFYPPNGPQNQNFIKTKPTPGDIILQMCTKMLGSHDVQFLRYGARMNRRKM